MGPGEESEGSAIVDDGEAVADVEGGGVTSRKRLTIPESRKMHHGGSKV